MTLALLTTTWLRPRLTRAVLEYTAALRVPGVELRPIAVYSPEDPQPVTDVRGITYVHAPNQPITNKWNAGAKAARLFDPDALMIFGSDDFLSQEWIDEAVHCVCAGADYVMPRVLHYYDAETGSAIRCDCIGKVGGGRTLSRALLDRLDWEPWQNGRYKNADGAMDRRIPCQPIRPDTPALLAVKTHQNEHSFDAMRRGLKGVDVDARSLLDAYDLEEWYTAA